jgi:hypothetical protein
MSSLPNPASADIPTLGQGPRAPTRHALGLPGGSIRAILSLMVVGLICILMLTSPADKPTPIPPYLIYLLFMALGHYFAAHGSSISRAGSGKRPPLGLPHGTVRLLLLILIIGTVAWTWYRNPEGLQAQMKKTMEQLSDQYWLPGVLLAGFFVGVIVHMVVGRENTPYWFEDVEAWVALVAVFGLSLEALIQFVINPSMTDPLIPTTMQAVIAALVAFYFGARS